MKHDIEKDGVASVALSEGVIDNKGVFDVDVAFLKGVISSSVKKDSGASWIAEIAFFCHLKYSAPGSRLLSEISRTSR